MTSNKRAKTQKKKVPHWLMTLYSISQANQEVLKQMAEISKLTQQTVLSQQWIEWQQIQKSILVYIREIDMTPVLEAMAEIRRLELVHLAQTIEASALAYRNYIDYISEFYQSSMWQDIIETSRTLALAHANMIVSFKMFTQTEARPKITISKEEKQAQKKVESSIDRLLAKLDYNFVFMRAGAWSTFNSNNPDRLRQSVASMRELLNHVLHLLSPGKTTRKDRIVAIMSENDKHTTEADFIESVADFVDKLYSLLSKIAHTVYKDEICVEMALKTTEDILFVLISKGLRKSEI